MFQYHESIINNGQSIRYQLFRKEKPLTFNKFLEHSERDKLFRTYFIGLIKRIPFQAYQWETPPVCCDTKDQPFEFVVTNNPGIDLPPDPGPFLQYFEEEAVAVFDNLGGDAKLIAPKPHPKKLNYSHIGVFTENAPLQQQQALWEKVGNVLKTHITNRQLWLNTAGGGVAWLHIRLDSRPKYYKHQPYRNDTLGD